MEKAEISRLKRNPYFKMQNTHSHDEYEIYYLLSGRRRIFIKDTFYTLEAGSFALVNSGEVHKTTNIGAETHERIILYLEPEYIRYLFGEDYSKILTAFDNPCLVPPAGMGTYIEGVLSRLETEQDAGGEFSGVMFDGYVRELLVFLYRCANSDGSAPLVAGNSAIEQAARYIIKNYGSDITLEDVSSYVNLSAGYFSKKFKSETGIGFKEYLVKIRIQNAARMLTKTDMKITDIAYVCGFNDSNYFGDAFTKMMNMSPSRYRKQKKEII